MLVGSTSMGRHPPIKFDCRVVAKRLPEDGAAAGTQNSPYLTYGIWQVEMVEDAAAENEVKRRVRERHRFGVVHEETRVCDSKLSGGMLRLVNCYVRNVDAHNAAGLGREADTVASARAAVLENIDALRRHFHPSKIIFKSCIQGEV